MPPKQKENYGSGQTEANPRDNFQTPRYATELLLDYLPLPELTDIWECANGDGAISRVLREHGYKVFTTDIRVTDENKYYDFIDGGEIPFTSWKKITIVTNPPFSSKLKRGFYERCVQLGLDFALLIPADYAGWLIDAVRYDGCKKLIPTRRIDYITPFIEELVFKGELLSLINKETGLNLKKLPKDDGSVDLYWNPKLAKEIQAVKRYSSRIPRYEKVEDIPEELIGKYSSSNFHSTWLTRGLLNGYEGSEVFVELTNEDKKRIL